MSRRRIRRHPLPLREARKEAGPDALDGRASRGPPDALFHE
jgi:hypothetical protein